MAQPIVISVFFFSSRRRHTRLQGDWSSDVCSSDLQVVGQPAHGQAVQALGVEHLDGGLDDLVAGQRIAAAAGAAARYPVPGWGRDRSHLEHRTTSSNAVAPEPVFMLEQRSTSNNAR